MNKFLALVFGALILTTASVAAKDMSRSETVSTVAKVLNEPVDLNRIIDQTNFVVNTGCSGTLIDLKEKYVLTAAHCVMDQYRIVEKEVFEKDGEVKKKKVRELTDGTVSQITFQGATSVSTTTYRTELVKVDKDVDLALLKIKGDIPNVYASKIACTEPKRGDRIHIVGNPMGTLYSSVTEGIVSSLQRDYELLGIGGSQEKEPLMQVSGGVIGGNSGGSVYNSDRLLVGVPVLGHRVNEVIAFAVPLPSIRAFLGDKVEKCGDGK